MKHLVLSFLLIIALTTAATAQMNVGSNTAPDGSAMLQISGTTKGFLPPRMNRDSMYLIANPARGLIVFNTTDSMLYLHRDSGWMALSAGEQQWFKSGNDIYNINSGNVGIGTTLPLARLHVADNSVLFSASGTALPVPGATPVSGEGRRTMWYADKAAFRTGYVSADRWDKDSIGDYSFAAGLDTKAAGFISTALGVLASAVGPYSISLGYNTLASGLSAIALGTNSVSTGPYSISMGQAANAGGYAAIAMGSNTTAPSYGETSIGMNNTNYTPFSTASWSAGDRLFTIGNGQNTESLSDAMVVLKNGNVGIGTTLPTSALHINATNPLTLTGVQTGTSAATDSVLTITNGLVRKIPVSTFGSGSGSVTSVSVTTSNGVSGTVTNATTTPAIKLTLGDITPNSIAANEYIIANGGIVANSSITTGSSVVVDNAGANNGNLSQAINFGGSDSGEGIASKRTGGGNQAGLDFYTNYTNRMAITQSGNVGIGTTAPTAALHVNATNPLTLTGVQLGTNTATDSVLTISNGVVKKLPNSTFANTTNAITSLNGLTGTTQTFTAGTTGTDFNIASSGTTHTFNIPDASATARGLITQGTQTIAGSKTFSASPTFSSLTAGSIPYIGTGGLINQNNANLFYDGAQLGIGTKLPTAALHINGTNPLKITGLATGTNTATDSVLTISAGVVKKLPASTFSTLTTGWSTTGNTGTNAANNFIGTTDAQDLVLKANGTERMRIVNGTSAQTGTAGDIKIGDATSGTVRSATELVMREDGDTYGAATLRLRNRNDENGAIFETVGASSGAYLVDFIFRTGATVASQITSNIRFETRSGNIKSTGNSTEWQFGQPDITNGGPTLVVGASGTVGTSNSSFRIGKVSIGAFAPTAALHLKAGSTAAGTAPLKINAGTNMTTPEAGAVEFDGTNYFITSGTTRYTLAKTLTATANLTFNSTAANSGSAATTTISVTGAVSGDVVNVGVPSGSYVMNGSYSAYVSAANTVTVVFNNYSTAAVTPTAGTFRVSILKY